MKIEWNAVLSVVCAAALAVVAMSGWMFDVRAPAAVQSFSTQSLTLPTTIDDDLMVNGDVVVAGALRTDDALTLPVNTENFGAVSVVTSSLTYTPTTGTVATIGAGEVWLVHSVYVHVTTSFDCTGDNCTLQIGDGGDPNGLVDLVDAELQTAAVDVTGAAAGWMGFMSDTRGAYLADGNAFVYAPSAGETIDFAVGGTNPAAGAATVYVVYTRIK